MGSFRSEFAERIGIETDSVDEVLEVLAEYVWGQVQDEGRCDIPGLGSFFVVDGRRIFEPSFELSRVVNHRYAGLSALAVEGSKSEILIPDAFSDSDESSAASFEPRWEELPAIDDDNTDVADVAPDFREASFADEEDSAPMQADSESLISSFLGLDSPSTTTGTDDLDILSHEIVGDSEPAVEESHDITPQLDHSGATVDSSDSDADTGTLGVVVPVDENAEPVVAKGKPRRSPWIYALPLVALAFIVLAVIWAQNRSTTPRPVQPTTEQDANVAGNDGNNADGTTDSGTGADEISESVDPTDTWSLGAINLEDGGWTIIVSSEPTKAEAVVIARELARELADTPLPVDVLESQVNGQTRYRVAVGQYRTNSVAQRDMDFLGSRLPTGSWALRLTDNT